MPIHVEVNEHVNQQIGMPEPHHHLLQHRHLVGRSDLQRGGLEDANDQFLADVGDFDAHMYPPDLPEHGDDVQYLEEQQQRQ